MKKFEAGLEMRKRWPLAVRKNQPRLNTGAPACALLRWSAFGVLPVVLMFSSLHAQAEAWRFHLEEATIADVHRAFKAKQLTATQLVNLYLKRIEAYNGTCVKGVVDPATGLQLGDITPVENAGQTHALITLNLRGERSRSDPVDNDPGMPDAQEVARALDAQFAKTGKLSGPLHGIPFAVKDQFDTRDMRSTSGAAANYANDRPPRDSEVVARLRAAGAIILAKANMGEYASGDRSTFGGTTCNPYDTSRSPGRSSGGPGAAVSANLVMCAIGEEGGPSARNPTANNSLVGIVATNTLVSRSGLVPFYLMRDRPGVLCRKVEDAAAILGAIAGFDPKDPITAASVGRMPRETYASFAENPSLKGARIGIVREFMQPFTKADEDSVRIANEAVADLARLGAVLVDPGPEGQLFKDAIAELVPSLDTLPLVSTFKELFPDGGHIEKLLEFSSDQSSMPADVTLRWLLGADTSVSGEALYAMNRYLQRRGDKVIKDVETLIENSIFYTHAPIDGVPLPPKGRLESNLMRTERLQKKEDGTPFTRTTPVTNLDIRGGIARQAVLQFLVLKVMADHNLDALVYPTKTVPAPLLGAPTEPATLRAVSETSTVTIDGVEYIRTVEKVRDARDPLAWTLSSAGGLPAIAVPAGFTREVYDRAAVVGADGSKKTGDLVGPKPIALPASIDFLGRPFSEPVLIRIAAAYQNGTRRRRPPKSFGPLPGEP
ncbi:MAG: amidase [Acidobacteria bacterium]|nr:amidase [Acidobacteriota bacterium]